MRSHGVRITGNYTRIWLVGLTFACFLIVLPSVFTSKGPLSSAQVSPGDEARLSDLALTSPHDPVASALPHFIRPPRFLKTSLFAPFASSLTATKSATLDTDVDGDGRFDPGDTIKYSVVISVTGMDA